MGRVTSDVVRGMSVTQFIGVGHIITSLLLKISHRTIPNFYKVDKIYPLGRTGKAR